MWIVSIPISMFHHSISRIFVNLFNLNTATRSNIFRNKYWYRFKFNKTKRTAFSLNRIILLVVTKDEQDEFPGHIVAGSISYCHLWREIRTPRKLPRTSCFNKSINSTGNIESLPFFYVVRSSRRIPNDECQKTKIEFVHPTIRIKW